jgi:SOS-response transcriptional repressor LexA
MGENAKSPTIDELAILLKQKSKRWVVQYLESLEKKGFLTRWRWYRSISLWNTVWFQTTLNVPILGYANAWTPLVDAVERGYWVLPISKKLLAGKDEKNYFILRVEGTSMNAFSIKWKNIENGTYVLIDKNDTKLNEKDAFLFIVNGAATLKKYKKSWNTIYLLPESNDTYHKPIILSEDDNIIVNWKIVDVFVF